MVVVGFVARVVCGGCGRDFCCGGFDGCGAGCVDD